MRSIKFSFFALIIGLSGCATFEQAVEVPAPERPTSEAPKSAEEQVVWLMAQPDQYLLSRKVMSDSQASTFDKALIALNRGDWIDLENGLKPWLSSPDTPSAFWVLLGDGRLGQVAETQEEAEKARVLGQAQQYFERALVVNGSNYHAHNRLGILLRERGQFSGALSHYTKAINAWPGFALAYLNRAILRDLYLGEKAAALDDYRLYQQLKATEPGFTESAQARQLTGWIADLERQLAQEG
ncbi:hypothetical protein P2G88_06290 [Aliiglaciecola sp. CAU 1673]|uniref:hypothetical protein n=1 Tax=Aliiglaciecola sp. CAU 1673 TaxID=3032595 RepID=UPI0023D9A412|nr:hypothetical protein [Aliiglaciecola sp. CAU 1673]MDF2177855.1 hypothetical protein [Aliiglaciecola sp. CAU 1673]